MARELVNVTKIGYNSDETVLTVAVNDKPINRYKFMLFPDDFDFEKPSNAACRPCDFYDSGDFCDDVRCCGFERKDKKGGYFIIAE